MSKSFVAGEYIVTLNQLQYVIEIAKTGSINNAAQRLFISQSALSTSISSLEKEIGQSIFVRSKRGVTLTSFGHTFISYVSSIKTQIDQLDHLVKYGTKTSAYNLSIASTGFYFLNKICANIYAKYRSNGIRIVLTEDHINNVADAVISQNANFGVIHLWSCYKKNYVKQIQSQGLQYYPITTLNVAVTIGKKNALYNQNVKELTPNDLAKFPTVMYTYNDSGPYSDIYTRLGLTDCGSRVVTSSRSVIYETLHNTDAWYLNSTYPFDIPNDNDQITYSDFRTLPIKDCKITSEIAWIKRADYTLSNAASEAVNLIMHYFSNDISF
jgi:DNA-binding transcriptional LysR family regulator